MESEYSNFSDAWYLEQYLKHGSVEEVYKAFRYNLYISPASFHRLVKRYGIVKSSGRREVSLPEILHFFIAKALEPALGIETLYYQMPPSFQTSLASLHRIYKRVITQEPRRYATALLIHNPGDKSVLLGHETKTQRLQAKFKGDLSLPMTFSPQSESYQNSILRVLQQEVFTSQAIEGKLKRDFIPHNPEPCMYITILDVEVQVFDLSFGQVCISDCNSFKLEDYNLAQSLEGIGTLRSGMQELLEHYWCQQTSEPIHLQSDLNRLLLAYA